MRGDVLEHVPDPRAFLYQQRRRQAPDEGPDPGAALALRLSTP
jgi:hypothetical protein